MLTSGLKFLGGAMIAVTLAACSSGGRTDSPSAGEPTSSLLTAGATVAAASAASTATTSTAASPTSSAAAVPTSVTTPSTTTAAPTTLDIEGSPMIEFQVEVDEALAGRLSRAELTSFVIETLSDERSWTGRGVGFRLVDEGGLFTLTVATPERVDQLCAPLRTVGRYSCARNGWIAFNSDRWFGATETWPADLETYRHYLVNHEVGHYVRGPSHDQCPGKGQPAPVMMQQTKGLDGCEPNGWVDP